MNLLETIVGAATITGMGFFIALLVTGFGYAWDPRLTQNTPKNAAADGVSWGFIIGFLTALAVVFFMLWMRT